MTLCHHKWVSLDLRSDWCEFCGTLRLMVWKYHRATGKGYNSYQYSKPKGRRPPKVKL